MSRDIIQFDAYYSDPHFEHSNIIKYCNRPFDDTNHMIEELIARYNDNIRSYDNVLWLGDCFFNRRGAEICNRLNGNKYILRGNHDKKISDGKFHELGFKEVYADHFLSTLDEFKVRFSHYPMAGYSEDRRYEELRPVVERGVTIIHGHTHDKMRRTHKDTIHVGVDGWEFRPALRHEVKELLEEINNESI